MAEFRISSLYERVFGYVAPPFPLSSVNLGEQLLRRVPFRELSNLFDQPMVMAVSLQRAGEDPWSLPIEPMIEIQGSSTIVRRLPQGAQRGSIKEHWSQDDYRVSLRGVFIASEEAYPQEDVERLRAYMEGKEAVRILSPLTRAFNITHLAIDRANFPHTPGLRNQAYELRGYSDHDDYALLEDA